MDERNGRMRALTAAERHVVGGGANGGEFLASVGEGAAAGAAVGARVGAVLLPPLGAVVGAVYGGFIGGFFGGAYYVVGELVDYCF